MLTRIWNTTTPLDDGFAGDGDDELKNIKVDIKERLEQDHYMGASLDPLQGDCDGYHRKVSLKSQASDPDVLSGTGVVYTKTVNGVVELYFKDSVTGIASRLTENGFISLSQLQANLDANSNSITGVGTLSATTANVTTVNADTANITTVNADTANIGFNYDVLPIRYYVHDYITLGTLYTALSTYVPNIGDRVQVSGAYATIYEASHVYIISHATRVTSTRISLYTIYVRHVNSTTMASTTSSLDIDSGSTTSIYISLAL